MKPAPARSLPGHSRLVISMHQAPNRALALEGAPLAAALAAALELALEPRNKRYIN